MTTSKLRQRVGGINKARKRNATYDYITKWTTSTTKYISMSSQTYRLRAFVYTVEGTGTKQNLK